MINPYKAHKNEHTAVIADSGSGKSVAVSQLMPPRGSRVILWDTNEDHKATSFDKLGDFLRALSKADKKSKETGAGFRVAYTGDESVKAFDVFCAAVCSVLDGDYITTIVIEELAGVSTSAGAARLPLRQLMNQGRKYGARVILTTQRPQEIPKTCFTQCKIFYVGMFGNKKSRLYVADAVGFFDRIQDLEKIGFLEFMTQDKNNALNPITIKKFKKTW